MKKNRNKTFGFTFIGFFVFFLTILFISTTSIWVYYFATKYTNENSILVALSVLGVILVGTFLFTLIDIYRRKKMIEEPVIKILDATEKISKGNFNVKLIHKHEYSKFDEYDLIFDNINTMALELSKNELLKNDFISNVSHEIKTPLAIIQNYAKSLQNENLSLEKKDEYLLGLINQTKKMSDLVSNILSLNKLENQQIIPEIEEFNVSELLRISILSFESLIEKKNLNLVCDIEDEIKIKSSKTLLQIVFNNLISNAIKFTNNNGEISISLKEINKSIIIKIKDSGCGISKEVGQHIFDKFYQADSSHFKEGNGLGLAIVKKTIDKIGGEIKVESKINVGSTFTIKLKKD